MVTKINTVLKIKDAFGSCCWSIFEGCLCVEMG